MADDAEPESCLHCLIGNAVRTRIGADANRWSHDQVCEVIAEITQGLAELIFNAADPDPESRNSGVDFAANALRHHISAMEQDAPTDAPGVH